MQVKEVMSRAPLTATWGEPLQSAFDKMQRAGIRHLPVLSEHGDLIGIISNRDLNRAMNVVESVDDVFSRAVFDDDKVVGDFMSSPVKTIMMTASVGDAARAMILNKISALVVVDRSRMMGIVTHEDLLRVLIDLLESHDSDISPVQRFAYSSPVGELISFLNRAGI